MGNLGAIISQTAGYNSLFWMFLLLFVISGLYLSFFIFFSIKRENKMTNWEESQWYSSNIILLTLAIVFVIVLVASIIGCLYSGFKTNELNELIIFIKNIE